MTGFLLTTPINARQTPPTKRLDVAGDAKVRGSLYFARPAAPAASASPAEQLRGR